MARSKSLLNDLSHALDLLESENVRLTDDNIRLQEMVTDDELHMQKVLGENAKLRELVRNAHACKTNEGCCEDCYQDEGCCPIERVMQRLGIEVK